MKDGHTRLNTILVFLDDSDRLLGFFPCFSGMAEDEKGIGNNIQLLTPFDQIVKIIDIDLLVDNFISHPLRSSL